jgi:hypothetical protein
LFDLIHPEDRQRVRDTYHDQATVGWKLQYRFHRRDDSVVWVEDVANLYTDAELFGDTLIGFLREIPPPND